MMKRNIWDKFFPCASVGLSWAHSLNLSKNAVATQGPRIHQKWVMLTVIIIKHTHEMVETEYLWRKVQRQLLLYFVFLFPAQTLSQVLV